jgi:hypothetical protein
LHDDTLGAFVCDSHPSLAAAEDLEAACAAAAYVAKGELHEAEEQGLRSGDRRPRVGSELRVNRQEADEADDEALPPAGLRIGRVNDRLAVDLSGPSEIAVL